MVRNYNLHLESPLTIIKGHEEMKKRELQSIILGELERNYLMNFSCTFTFIYKYINTSTSY